MTQSVNGVAEKGISSDFQPPRWLRGPHGQTVLARYLRPEGGVLLRRERVEMPDGDFVDLDWAFPELLSDQKKPLIIVLHGLEGSARSRYALELYRQLAELGVPSVGLNFRGCSGPPNRGMRFYHSGETGDPRFVFEMLRARNAGRRLGAIGFSLGGNVLLKYLAEDAVDTPISAAAVMSVPFDLSAGSSFVETGIARIYMRKLLRSLKLKVRRRRDEVSDVCDVPRAMSSTNFREFDDAVTSVIHGFENAEHYYSECSSYGVIDRIRTPTLVIHALDDPFLPADRIPIEALRANDDIHMRVCDSGGHVGFLDRHLEFWGEKCLARHVTEMLG